MYDAFNGQKREHFPCTVVLVFQFTHPLDAQVFLPTVDVTNDDTSWSNVLQPMNKLTIVNVNINRWSYHQFDQNCEKTKFHHGLCNYM
jgi:hypothetical protein